MPDVERRLKREIFTVGRRGVKQRQAQVVVGGFVPAVFAIIEHRDSIATIRRTHSGPMLGIDLVLCRCIIASLDRADSQVVTSLRTFETHRELRFEQGTRRPPVNLRAYVDTVVHSTVCK